MVSYPQKKRRGFYAPPVICLGSSHEMRSSCNHFLSHSVGKGLSWCFAQMMRVSASIWKVDSRPQASHHPMSLIVPFPQN